MGTTAEKLQRLLDNKVLIANSINAKAGTSFNVNSKFSDMATAINNISGENLLQKKLDSGNASGLFAYWTEKNLDEYINSLDFSSVTDMTQLFYGCSKLTSIPQLNTSNVTDMVSMFSYCSSLTSVPQLNTSKVTEMGGLFMSCPRLETIAISYYNISSVSNVSYFANGCTALKSLIIREFGQNYALHTNSFTGSGIANGTGYIYVPKNMVDTLKSETNWSTYASQIRALEDYTVDGTTSGALDTNKI